MFMWGYIHTYFLEYMGYENSTYNRRMSSLRSFVNWCRKNKKAIVINPFEDVKSLEVEGDDEVIHAEEYFELLDTISLKTGYGTRGKKKPQVIRYWQPYLKPGIMLCLETGGRREEVVILKWNMIYEINEEPAFVICDNLKVDRIKKTKKAKPKVFPVTESFRKLLYLLGYERHKNKDRYLICPNREIMGISNTKIVDNFSRGFTHFYKQLNTGRNVSLKHLRNTNITYLTAQVGEDEAGKFTSHATKKVLKEHYLNEEL